MRIVLVEDNLSLAKGIENALKDQGHAVDHLDDGLDADAFLARQRADIAIVDVNLPRLSGIEIIRRARARRDTLPMLILTARGKTSERVEGLDAGADDYLVKPFDMGELGARLRALVRRASGAPAPLLRVGEITLDPAAREVRHADRHVDLSVREFALLEALMRNAGRVLTRSQLEQALYAWGEEVESNALEVHVHHLRRKLDPSGIKTVRGVGYLMARAELA